MEMRYEPKRWGGKRDGAGRKKVPGGPVPHTPRDPHKRRFPVHVTLRVLRDVGNLRAKRPFALIREAIRRAGVGREEFRVVHYSVLKNHLHLIVEANDERSLGRGMQGLTIRIARRVNRLFGRKGTFFSDRYHRHDLTTPREARNALAYVLQNFRRHEHQCGRRCARNWIDPCSSGRWFDGWSGGSTPLSTNDALRPVSPAQSWLLDKGWRRHGPISRNEIPGYDEW